MIELIDEGSRIMASSEVPGSITRKMPEENVTVFYIHNTDWIVLNKGNKHYAFYGQILDDYLELSDRQKKEFLKYAREKGMTFFNFINQILRIRRRCKHAKSKTRYGRTG